jgi:hypothetical protein
LWLFGSSSTSSLLPLFVVVVVWDKAQRIHRRRHWQRKDWVQSPTILCIHDPKGRSDGRWWMPVARCGICDGVLWQWSSCRENGWTFCVVCIYSYYLQDGAQPAPTPGCSFLVFAMIEALEVMIGSGLHSCWCDWYRCMSLTVNSLASPCPKSRLKLRLKLRLIKKTCA